MIAFKRNNMQIDILTKKQTQELIRDTVKNSHLEMRQAIAKLDLELQIARENLEVINTKLFEKQRNSTIERRSK